MKYELIATATFGLEAVVKMELQDLGYSVVKVEDGKVTFIGDERAIAHTNIWLRTADRVYIKVAEFRLKPLKNYSSRFAVSVGRIISRLMLHFLL